ncbi:hypothetical protein EV356DRAFT_13207 [Viridothelium virens]|uniref:Secreted protein n=1 Tax=Viridothelium virens TaxID=1048519 RepID=A0A6A6HGT2_VIRVR|nr:hypothetical protein EV356DRAFT_13207 [Viridothelium virens]
MAQSLGVVDWVILWVLRTCLSACKIVVASIIPQDKLRGLTTVRRHLLDNRIPLVRMQQIHQVRSEPKIDLTDTTRDGNGSHQQRSCQCPSLFQTSMIALNCPRYEALTGPMMPRPARISSPFSCRVSGCL